MAEHTIRKHASVPVEIRGISLQKVRRMGIFPREHTRKGGQLYDPISEAPMATEFAITRFLVPWLTERTGHALFIDCDFMAIRDVADLFAEADPAYALQVVKHEHIPTEKIKMDGQRQTTYGRKNWSSCMLWNLDHPAHDRLDLEIVNTLPGRDLHQFAWLEDDEIGDLSLGWNWLAGVSPSCENIGFVHYTLGGPWFAEYQDVPYADLWLAAKAEMEGRA